jgi:hypothetical protein
MRHRVTLPRDTGYATLGDSGWVGVDMRREPSQLPPGFASEAINMRFRNGVAETRKGFVRLTWANKISAGSVQPWGDIDGIGEFKDPNTLATYLVVSAGSSITYITRQCSSASALSVPSGYTAADSTTFTQAFDTLVMFRGATLPPLSMPTIDTGFQEIAQTIEGTYTNPIPNADRGLFFQNRLFIPSNNDEIVISDFGDYTRYLPVVNQLRINQGSSDSIVNIAKFNDTTMIVFKDHSIYALRPEYCLPGFNHRPVWADCGRLAFPLRPRPPVPLGDGGNEPPADRGQQDSFGAGAALGANSALD